MLPRAVSVVIPTYNHADFVRQTLDSVFAQTFADYEVIVVNDGSPDNTADLLRPLADAGRIQYVEQVNGGQARARNTGIALARGEFIALLDDDDLWPPDKLAWQVAALRARSDALVVYGRPVCVDAAGAPVPAPAIAGQPVGWLDDAPSGNVYEAFMARNFLLSPGQALIRRSALCALGDAPFDPAIRGCDDWDVWLRLARCGAPFLYENRASLFYRLHAGNASRNLRGMYESDLMVRAKHLATEPDPRTRAAWRRLHARSRLNLARLLWAEAVGRNNLLRPADRAAHLLRALRLHPRVLMTDLPGLSRVYWSLTARTQQGRQSA